MYFVVRGPNCLCTHWKWLNVSSFPKNPPALVISVLTANSFFFLSSGSMEQQLPKRLARDAAAAFLEKNPKHVPTIRKSPLGDDEKMCLVGIWWERTWYGSAGRGKNSHDGWRSLQKRKVKLSWEKRWSSQTPQSSFCINITSWA